MSLYSVAGLATQVDLPVPLIIDLIPTSQTNQRPGITRQKPGYWVQHETANPSPGADAEMHNRWLHNGAGGAKLSFHFAVDDGVIYQMIPIDEVTWQAADGGGPGNMSGISCELCINQGIDTAKSRHNAEALCGGILKALGMNGSLIKRHWDFNAGSGDRHHCPDQMMNENYWPTFVANATKIIAAQTGPVYAKPAPITWEKGDTGVHDLNGVKAMAFVIEVVCTKAAEPKQSSVAKAPATGPVIKTGTHKIGIGSYRAGAASNAFLVLDDGSRVKRSSFRPLVPLI